MKQIVLMIDSASRPDLLRQTVESLKENLRFSGTIKWIHHEAWLKDKESSECMKYAEKNKFKRMVSMNPKGECVSISRVLTQLISLEDKYFIHWEDDHILLRPLDLDLCYDLMENHLTITQIAFNKRQTMSEVSGWKKKEFKFGEQMMTTSPHWRFSPAMWRLSWILPRFEAFEGSNGHWNLNAKLQEGFQPNKTADLVARKLGTFYLGPIGELAYVKHIGKGRSGRTENK